eukprot:scaffold98553_cov63-Phaeocystis_antarctica.AAC.1
MRFVSPGSSRGSVCAAASTGSHGKPSAVCAARLSMAHSAVELGGGSSSVVGGGSSRSRRLVRTCSQGGRRVGA